MTRFKGLIQTDDVIKIPKFRVFPHICNFVLLENPKLSSPDIKTTEKLIKLPNLSRAQAVESP